MKNTLILLGAGLVLSLIWFWTGFQAPVRTTDPEPEETKAVISDRAQIKDEDLRATSVNPKSAVFSLEEQFRFDQTSSFLQNDPKQWLPDAKVLATPGLKEIEYAGSVHSLLQEYKVLVKDGGYPTGLNVEITNALLGKNPRKIALLDQNHPRINSEGELVDQWGTPYEIHVESMAELTIRSGGPDRKTYTDDDIIYGHL